MEKLLSSSAYMEVATALPKAQCSGTSQSVAAALAANDQEADHVALLRPGMPMISPRLPVLSGRGISGWVPCVTREMMSMQSVPTGGTAVPKAVSSTGKHIWLRV